MSVRLRRRFDFQTDMTPPRYSPQSLPSDIIRQTTTQISPSSRGARVRCA
jgi:hypothetical protein